MTHGSCQCHLKGSNLKYLAHCYSLNCIAQVATLEVRGIATLLRKKTQLEYSLKGTEEGDFVFLSAILHYEVRTVF